MSKLVRTVVIPSALYKPVAPYSQAVIADRTVYVSGCLGVDPTTKNMVEGGAGAQMKKALENLKATVIAAGSSVENVVKATVFITDMADFPAVNTEYSTVFTANYPARSCVQVSKLPLNALVEIEAIAMIGEVEHKVLNA